MGSLCLEDDEDRNSLKSHFDNLASSLCEGVRYVLVCLHKFIKAVSDPFSLYKGTKPARKLTKILAVKRYWFRKHW